MPTRDHHPLPGWAEGALGASVVVGEGRTQGPAALHRKCGAGRRGRGLRGCCG